MKLAQEAYMCITTGCSQSFTISERFADECHCEQCGREMFRLKDHMYCHDTSGKQLGTVAVLTNWGEIWYGSKKSIAQFKYKFVTPSVIEKAHKVIEKYSKDHVMNW